MLTQNLRPASAHMHIGSCDSSEARTLDFVSSITLTGLCSFLFIFLVVLLELFNMSVCVCVCVCVCRRTSKQSLGYKDSGGEGNRQGRCRVREPHAPS